MRAILLTACLAAVASGALGAADRGPNPVAPAVSAAGAAGAVGGEEARIPAGAALALEQHPDGRLTATGTLPAGLSPETISAMLPGAGAEALPRAGTPGRDGWGGAVEAVSIVLPRFLGASAQIEDGALALRGELRSGFSAEGARAALISALPRDWTLSLEISETDPPAELVIEKGRGSPVLSGLLPAGLRPEDATALIGQGAKGEGLAGGGAGNAASWSRTVAALGGVIGLFDAARARIEAGSLVVEGVLRPGYPPDAVAERLSRALPGGWQARLDATETQPGEGDRRIGLATGEAEVFRSGFWMPELDFPVSPERCRAEASAAMQRGPALFANGSTGIESEAQALVNRLAAIAVRCLNSSELRLEIAGHTESVGNDAENQVLSEARARAVLDALLERGVRADALSAVGRGESQPIASNDTAEGRARNNRIAFEWSGS